MIKTIDKYQELLENIPQLINESKFKKEYIITALNLTRSTFYNKLSKKGFTPVELLKLSTILFPEEANEYALKKSLEQAGAEIKRGNVRNHEDVMADFRKRYGVSKD